MKHIKQILIILILINYITALPTIYGVKKDGELYVLRDGIQRRVSDLNDMKSVPIKGNSGIDEVNKIYYQLYCVSGNNDTTCLVYHYLGFSLSENKLGEVVYQSKQLPFGVIGSGELTIGLGTEFVPGMNALVTIAPLPGQNLTLQQAGIDYQGDFGIFKQELGSNKDIYLLTTVYNVTYTAYQSQRVFYTSLAYNAQLFKDGIRKYQTLLVNTRIHTKYKIVDFYEIDLDTGKVEYAGKTNGFTSADLNRKTARVSGVVYHRAARAWGRYPGHPAFITLDRYDNESYNHSFSRDEIYGYSGREYPNQPIDQKHQIQYAFLTKTASGRELYSVDLTGFDLTTNQIVSSHPVCDVLVDDCFVSANIDNNGIYL